ncbi:unnamed protein product [Enterobius vermicularis]|uniref:RING-type domain-containing protein n=1 Tax=Enterobius vermicularis TaxID=51028 RepID=A0A0N4V926_ENTVE|nr:unnamed protein product [Enterobius vermicularis]
MMEEADQTTSSFNAMGIRERFLAAVERARAQDFTNLVEELQIIHELTSLRDRPDTIVVVDEDEPSNSPSVLSQSRHRSTPRSTSVTPTGDDTSNNETDAPSPDGPRERPEFTRLSARQRQEFPRLQQAQIFAKHRLFFIGVGTVFNVLSFKTDPVLEKTFFMTFCAVLIAHLFIKVVSIQVKILVAAFPSCLVASKRQRRFFQWLEYSSQVYQYSTVIPQWCCFFIYAGDSNITRYSGYCFAFVYVLFKAFCFIELGKCWLNSTRYVHRLVSVGTKPSPADIDYQQRCAICFANYDTPIELSCRHIFCEECISTWLDKEHSCPLCRAIVTKEDNFWKSGDTCLLPQVF